MICSFLPVTTLKYLSQGGHRRSEQETFIPLDHEAGQRIEADFGEIQVDFPEGRRKVNVLILVNMAVSASRTAAGSAVPGWRWN